MDTRKHAFVIVVMLGVPGALSAQTPQQQDRESLQTVIVTAQKRESALQDVPFSIAAFTESQIRNSGASGIPELDRFARGLTDDRAAVEAGLTLAWSNGQTEGQVNKLKLLKRSMYGRANFDLLRRRLLQAA